MAATQPRFLICVIAGTTVHHGRSWSADLRLHCSFLWRVQILVTLNETIRRFIERFVFTVDDVQPL